jgi:hypothetical protein
MPIDAAIADAGMAQPRTVRDCDGCTLCCKVMEVQEIAKPGGQWCQHCTTGVGCGIYAARPRACSAYVCGYLTISELGPEWKPATSRLVLPATVLDGSIIIQVDPARPDAWKKQPYYAELQKWAERALAHNQRVVVYAARRSIVILPDHAADLGDVRPEELIVILSGTNGFAYEAYAVQREVWARIAPEVAVLKTIVPDKIGFRTGRRVA